MVERYFINTISCFLMEKTKKYKKIIDILIYV